MLSALRGPRKSPFDEHEREVARFLLPRVTRAWTVHERLKLLSAGEPVLDTLSMGVVFLAAGGGVAAYCNGAAEEILRAEDGLSLRNGQLCELDGVADWLLQKAVCHALSPSHSLGPAAVTVPRVSLRRAYHVVAALQRTRFPQFAGMPCPMAVVLITDPERQQAADANLLMQLYGLTRKEAARRRSFLRENLLSMPPRSWP